MPSETKSLKTPALRAGVLLSLALFVIPGAAKDLACEKRKLVSSGKLW